MELFDAFEVDDVKPINNQMSRLENDKINQARQLSNDLLARMSTQKRPALKDGDDERPTKITITGYYYNFKKIIFYLIIFLNRLSDLFTNV